VSRDIFSKFLNYFKTVFEGNFPFSKQKSIVFDKRKCHVNNFTFFLQIRYINHVELVNNYQARFGSGANFGTVLKHIPPEHYTLIHGQSLTVGTAGFLQGLGVNPMGTSQRYGFGSEQVSTLPILIT
jgi:hypothetical protein